MPNQAQLGQLNTPSGINDTVGQNIDNTQIPFGTNNPGNIWSSVGINPPQPFQQPTQGIGMPVQLPQGSNLTGLMNNPFGITPPKGLGKYNTNGNGSTNIFGGPQDLMKSLATSSMGINLLNQQYQQGQQGMLPQGVQGAISGYAANNPYLASMTQAYLPQLQTQGFQQQQSNLGQLRDMMNNAYMLQGSLYGGQLQGVAQAKAQAKAKEAQKKQFLSSVIGGAASGLTGNQFGEGDTSAGLGGAIG